MVPSFQSAQLMEADLGMAEAQGRSRNPLGVGLAVLLDADLPGSVLRSGIVLFTAVP